jgi:23S rRNA (uracil1939-C5)-methyltransferase
MTEIVRLAARGDGVDDAGGFHALVAPGDTIDNGTITPGPHRIDPACRHFPRCGGCQLQHIDDASYAVFLVDRIVGALAAQGLSAEIAMPHLSPPGARRRVALRAMRRGKQVMLGFAEAGSHKLIDLAQCPVMHPDLFALLKPLRTLLPHLVKDRSIADIRMTLTDQGVDVLLKGVAAEGLAAAEALGDFGARNRLARLSLDEGYGPSVRWEPDPVTVTLGGTAVALPEGAFLQATKDGETALITAVKDAVSGSVIDLFAGLGTFTFASGATHAVEGARDAFLSLQMAANHSGRIIKTEHRDLFRRPMTAAEFKAYDSVIIDPPRAGAKEQVAEIAAAKVPVVASVSCNPATFARDAKMLTDVGYKIDWIRPVGQFRWSTHTELAARFSL